jgi:hypothetical protein
MPGSCHASASICERSMKQPWSVASRWRSPVSAANSSVSAPVASEWKIDLVASGGSPV